MFDVGFSELLIIAVVALLVLGPERLPKAARFAGLWVRRARAQWYSVKSEFERELAQEDLKRHLAEPMAQLRPQVEQLQQDLRAPFDGLEAKMPAPVDLRTPLQDFLRAEPEGVDAEAQAALAPPADEGAVNADVGPPAAVAPRGGDETVSDDDTVPENSTVTDDVPVTRDLFGDDPNAGTRR
jgi:sec-independent protein translocase protein TatB